MTSADTEIEEADEAGADGEAEATVEADPRYTVPFTLNGVDIKAAEGELLIDACDRAGIHIPRFCYHPRMKPVGMCRMCLVEVDTGRGPGLQPSCMVPVSPEMKVETESEVTKHAQDGVLELLLANHPLDCPVCDKGGECPLQDNAYAFGPGESRFVEEKRHFEKPIPISDLVHLDRERCILCDRCTRFADDVAGDPLIHFIDRGSQTQVNTFPDDPFASYFSGNTVQICPVGALTAAPYRFKARPWDLETVESTAAVDSSGARVALQSSFDELIRIVGVDSDAVNWSWLSDKERFIYEATNADDRVTEPMISSGEMIFSTSRWADALDSVASALDTDPERVGVIGGSRLSVEGQYAWAKLLKGVIGTDNVDAQLGDGPIPATVLGLPRTTIGEAFQPGSVVVSLGVDLKEELPTLYLRLRHAVLEDGVRLLEFSQRKTSLSSLAATSVRVKPGQLGNVLADIVNLRAGALPPSVSDSVRALMLGEAPVTTLFGRANLAESAQVTSEALREIARSNPAARFLPVLRRGNVIGAIESGMVPGYMPGGALLGTGPAAEAWPSVPAKIGRSTSAILRAAAAGEIDTLILVGADPIGDFPNKQLAERALSEVSNIIAVDTFLTDSSARASVVIPAAMYGEQDGTFCNLEGRLSKLSAKVTKPGSCKDDWQIPVAIADAIGTNLGFASLNDVREDLSANAPSFAAIDWAQVDSNDDGPVLNLDRTWALDLENATTSATDISDDNGDDKSELVVVLDHKLWDLGTMVMKSPSLVGLGELAALKVAPADAKRLRLNGSSDEVAVTTKDGREFSCRYAVDDHVEPGTVWANVALSGFDARLLVPDRRGSTASVHIGGITNG